MQQSSAVGPDVGSAGPGVYFSRHAAAVAAAFTLIFAWLYGRALWSDLYLVESDLYEYFLPLFLSNFAAWSTFEFCGIPIFSDPGESFAYPLYVIFSKVIGSWTWFVISAHVLAACGTYAYIYVMTRRAAASFLAALAFGLSEAMVERVAHMTTLHTIAWMPWAFVCIEQYLRSRHDRWVALGAIAIACVILAGHPQPAFYACLASGAYALSGGIGERKPTRYFVTIGAMFAIGALLAAVKWLPFLQVTQHMARDTINFGQFIGRGNIGPQLWTALFPTVLHDGREAPTYVGLATLLFALVGATYWRRDWRIAFWVAAVIVCAMFGIGEHSPIARFAFDYVPGYNRFRVGARHLIVASFGCTVLAGFGVRYVLDQSNAGRRLIVAAGALVAIVAAGLTYLMFPHPGLQFEVRDPLPWTHLGLPDVLTNELWTQLFLAVATVAGAVGITRSRRTYPWIAMTAFILMADLLNAQPFGLSPIGIRAVVMPRSAAEPSVHAAAIGAVIAPTHQRSLSIGGTARDAVLPAAWARLWQIPIAGGYGPMLLERHSEMSTMGRNGAVRAEVLARENRSLDLLAVRTITVQRDDVASRGTVEFGGVTWEREPWDLTIGRGDCGYQYSRTVSIALPADVEIGAVHLLGYLRCSEDVAQGTEVGTVSIATVDGNRVSKQLRAGIEIADASLANPEVRQRARHQPAAVVDDPAAGGALRSLITLTLPTPTHANRLDVTAAGLGGWMVVGRVTLADRSGRQFPQVASQAFLRDPTRWRQSTQFRTSRYSDRGVDRGGEGEQDYSVYENLRALPRAWIASSVESLELKHVLPAIHTSQLPDGRPFDPLETALVATEDGAPAARAFGNGPRDVRIVDVVNGRISLRTTTSTGGFLVVSETYYPGWRAAIDGRDVDLFRADYSLQGVVVPAGTHDVVFTFTPTLLYVGAAMSIVGLGAVMFLLARGDARQRPPD